MVTLFNTGVIDNSGMRFYYTSIRREHDAGLLSLGNSVSTAMIIPPNATNYTIAGLCTSKCTKKVLSSIILVFEKISIIIIIFITRTHHDYLVSS